MEIIPTAGRSLTEAERSVISYLNANPAHAAEQTILEIAEQSFTSAPTVSRAIRKCGFSDLPEVRRCLLSNSGAPDEPYLMNEVLALSYRDCAMTIENIKLSDILKTVKLIREADKIFVLSRGITVHTAEEFRTQLSLLRFSALPITDSEVMKRMDHLLRPNDLVIIFTVANSTPEFKEALNMAKSVGAKTVVCCCRPSTALDPLADVVIRGISTPIVEGNAFHLSSRLPLQIISRSIIEYLAKK